MKIRFNASTVFKAMPIQSSELDEASKIEVEVGENFEIVNEPYLIEGVPGEGDDHFLVQLPAPPRTYTQETRWCVYCPHVEVIGNVEGNQPFEGPADLETPSGPLTKVPIVKDIPAIKWGPLIPYDIPGLSNRVRLRQPIFVDDPVWGTANFTWGEALHGDRIPVNDRVTQNIIRMAKTMQSVRRYLGDRPIIVNSWYRPPDVNRKVGGASRSRHLAGDAVDFVVKGIDPHDVFTRLDGWYRNKGGLASSDTFTHIDGRKTKARWKY